MTELKRVVITGMGITSNIGLGLKEVLKSLRERTSGITFNPAYKEMGLRSWVSGSIDVDPTLHIPRKDLRFMADAAIFAYLSLKEAIEDAGLSPAEVSSTMTGLIAGSGGASSANQVAAADILRESGVKKIGPYRVTKCSGNTVSACLASPFDIKGMGLSITSACSTSGHCIMMAADQIKLGNQKIMFAGGGEEEHWSISCLFDAMGALSTNYNDDPTKASRPWDENRDGFVISAGGGFLVLEEMESAIKRNAKIYAELGGYSATSDGEGGVVAPSGDGSIRCMQNAVGEDLDIDYINAHATSTPVGDAAELNSIRKVFGDRKIPVSSTKSQAGHSLGAAGVQESIHSLLMMENNFIAGTLNLETPPEDSGNINLVAENQTGVKLKRVISNAFGFGGTNSCLLFNKLV
ncbi:MAG: beta-ketoacyl-ACP synthase I [Gammaproteobacteria bacterium]|nr:beta-ketoacyl-ACP synthase I [Gammaproteobacteria bacterium]